MIELRSMADLFCGAGIGAVGFKNAGVYPKFAIDNVQYAVDTYNQNIKDVAICQDIRDLDMSAIPDVDFITGGFPCQPFSFGGKGNGVEDDRGDLGLYFLKAVETKMPNVFLMENVKGLISKKNKPFFLSLIEKFEEIGYNVYWELTNCAEYGVPQIRDRVMVVGFRKDLGITKFEWPEKIPKEEYQTIGDAIGELPEPPQRNWNHDGYGIRNDERPFVHKVPIGGNWKDLPVEDQKIFMGGAFNSGGGRTGYLKKVSFDRPSGTITSTMNGKFNAQIVDLFDKYCEDTVHNMMRDGVRVYRRFTVRECLRLQTVPDDFYFSEEISIPKQYARCSGIPSLVAEKLTNKIRETLNEREL